MGPFSLEHSKAAYVADFAFYGAVTVALAALMMIAGPPGQRLRIIAWVGVGLSAWPLIEYLIHRFILHNVQPFRRWHEEHHRRPMALIGTPTALSAMLISVLVLLPALLVGGPWLGGALTLGVVAGYTTYGVTHHATHHWRGRGPWLKARKRWHALHHRSTQAPVCFGVTGRALDRIFGSIPRP